MSAIDRCEVVYIAPDVPTDDDGQSDLSGIRRLIDTIVPALRPARGAGRALSGSARFHPQSYGAAAGPPLLPGRDAGVRQAVERATQPERCIVGCADPSKPLDPRFRAVLEAFGCPILPMRYESAELAKISINMCLVASIGVANTLAELSEGIGAVWSEIVPALKLDRRIGRDSYLTPGLGIAGGNLERDLATVERLAVAHGSDAGIVRAWLANSRHRRDWAARTIRSVLLDAEPDAVVAVWGLAYKENTHSVKNSPSLATIEQLQGARLRLHDPLVPASVARHPRAQGFATPLEAAHGADALMILTPWPQYREIAAGEIVRNLKGRIVLDPYAVLDNDAATAAGLRYYTLGRPAPAADMRAG